MGKYVNRGNDGFKSYLNGEYVDKTGLIEYINGVINTVNRLTCVTRPRRFGKTAAAQMLYAYYDKASESKDLFERLQISKADSYERYLNKFPTVYIDVTRFTTRYAGRDDIVDILQQSVMKDIQKAYPDVEVDDDADLMELLEDIAFQRGEKFVMIIDEWDAICREAIDKPQLMDRYVNFLRTMFKSSNTATVFACVYMTGILPIKRYGTQSALNDFREFSMTSPLQLAGYIGFTENEVRTLCAKYDMDYDEMKGWYDGYSFGPHYPAVFNPNSVMAACLGHTFDNYWGRTSAFETLQQYIDIDLNGVQESLERIIRGERQKVSVLRFGFDLSSIGTYDELLTLMVHLGYLTYDAENMTVSIPNKEIRMEFTEALRGSKSHKKLAEMVKTSDKLLEATLNGNEQTVAEIVDQIHNHEVAPEFYNNEQALRSVLKLGFISAIDYFVTIQELPSGKGYADIAFIPNRQSSKPAVIVELKWNKGAYAAIDQIKNRDYPSVIRNFTKNIMLVGISYDTDTKQHSCRIEQWEK